MAYIKAYLADLDKLKEALKCQHKTVITHWEPPSKSQVKVNFDSAFLQPSNKAVLGIITKNYTGLVIGLCSYLIHSVRDLTIVEAYTCLEGAVFAEEIGFSDVIMEGDSRIVIKKLQNHGNDRSAIWGVINKIIAMSRIFWNIEFRSIPREANGAAYAMAAWGRES
ncbi:hypothetical protein Golob_017399, partial [Gossypium lobatum]|nr:hypothetical protein [Gossypium lobatum]